MILQFHLFERGQGPLMVEPTADSIPGPRHAMKAVHIVRRRHPVLVRAREVDTGTVELQAVVQMDDPQGGLTNTRGSKDAMIAVQAVLRHRRQNHGMDGENVELQATIQRLSLIHI